MFKLDHYSYSTVRFPLHYINILFNTYHYMKGYVNTYPTKSVEAKTPQEVEAARVEAERLAKIEAERKAQEAK